MYVYPKYLEIFPEEKIFLLESKKSRTLKNLRTPSGKKIQGHFHVFQNARERERKQKFP